MITLTLDAYLEDIKKEFDQIPKDRKLILETIAAFVTRKVNTGELANLILICTHNSRRSHFSQVMTQVAAYHYGIHNVFSYSGGTEATALFPTAVMALEKAGLQVNRLSEGENPVYSIKYEGSAPAVIGFSKKYNDAFNPSNGFAAIMTCNNADTNCPFIPEADARISLPFEDPKAYDGTPEQIEKYEERLRDITRELMYAFSNVVK